jgi:signal transduction histidine kinase
MARATTSNDVELDLTDIVRRAAEELGREFAERGLSLRTVVPDEAVEARGDRAQLEQVLIELLSNAMDHSKPGDTVVLTCRRIPRERRAVISVEDQGPGVPPEIRPRIFDLFFTTKPGGTGLGLATIKRYARLHGGDVTLEVATGGGAKFVVFLPLSGGNGALGGAARKLASSQAADIVHGSVRHE